MDSRGRLAVFKPQHNNNNNNKTWRMLDTEHAAFDYCSEAYLMESSNSELISVVVTASTSSAKQRPPIRVVKFNDNLQKWHNISRLNGLVVFLSRHSCLVISAPVFHNGAFYSMDSRGRLAVFKPQHNNNNKTWRMLDTEHAAFDDCSEAYLMESSNSELISVVVTASTSSAKQRPPIRVVKFNDNLQKWHNISRLNGLVVFLSRHSCLVMQSEELQVKGLKNTIHFPRFHGSCHVFYSLVSNRFHTFEGGYTSQDLRDTQLPFNCTWMVPQFQQFDDQQLN
ncbi:hypothetical protein LINPERHAP1_LOCUS20357 [Linum perenne]